MAVQYNPGIVTDGLVLYLDAANPKSYPGTGTGWNDISGNNRNFSWLYGATYTSSGALSYFSTLGNICRGPASNSFGINNTSGYTIFIMCYENSATQAATLKFYKNGANENEQRGISLHATFSQGANNGIYIDQGGCCTTAQRTSYVTSSSFWLNSWNIYCFKKDSSVRTILKNNSLLASNTTGAANIDLNSTAVDLGNTDIGAFGGGGTYGWNARLNSCIIYNRGLDDQEITQNFNALRGRFGI